nr:hypothetical protein [uncultured Caproiciproducens sp.]
MKSEAKRLAEQREAAKEQEEKKREAKKKAARTIEAEPCLYCGKPTLCREYIINQGAEHELPCCSEECFDRTKKFVDYDTHGRLPFYLVLLALVVANLVLISFKAATRWAYLPLFGMGITACVCPLIFTRYERYQKFGISKTKTVIRFIAAAISVFALILIICH